MNGTRQKRYIARGGFSLLEISLVVVLIGLLTAGTAIAVLGRSKAAKIGITKTTMNNLSGQIDSYIAAVGNPPTTLDVLVQKDYVKASTLMDAWKTPFYYNANGINGEAYTLLSYGPDKQAGTTDDINVWTMDLTDNE